MDDCFGDQYKEKESLTCTDTIVSGKKEIKSIYFRPYLGNGREIALEKYIIHNWLHTKLQIYKIKIFAALKSSPQNEFFFILIKGI